MASYDRPAVKWQFSILDLLIVPCAIAVSAVSAISIDLLASDAADLLFDKGWTKHGRALVDPFAFWGAGDPVESTGVVLSLPSIVSVIAIAFLFGATRTRFGIQVSLFLPISHLFVSTWFLAGTFVLLFHFMHVVAIAPCWSATWMGHLMGGRLFLRRPDHSLLAFRIACWALLAFLVTTSGHWYQEYQREIEELFETL